LREFGRRDGEVDTQASELICRLHSDPEASQSGGNTEGVWEKPALVDFNGDTLAEKNNTRSSMKTRSFSPSGISSSTVGGGNDTLASHSDFTRR